MPLFALTTFAPSAPLAALPPVVVVGVEQGAPAGSSGSALPEPSFLSGGLLIVTPKRRSSPEAAESDAGSVMVAVSPIG